MRYDATADRSTNLENAAELVADWSARHPEANAHLYNDTTAWHDWKRTAAAAVLAAWQSGEDAEAAIQNVSRFDDEQTATYIITNDRYSNQPDKVTFNQLVEMCRDNEWDTNLRERGGKVLDAAGEVVAVAA